MATFDWDGNRKPGRSPFATYTDSPAYNIQSRSLGNKTKGSNISFGDILGKVSAVGSGITGILGSVNSLATPQGGDMLNDIKSQAVSLNRTKVGGSMDNIYSTAMNFTPLKTNYRWKDFYADGGYLDNPYYYDPNTYDAGGRMATGILGSTASGATAGAAFGPWGAAIGGAVGLIGGLFGANSGKKKAKRMANQANAASELANEGMQMKIDNAIDDAKRTQLIGYENAKPYAFGGNLDGAIGYGFMTDYLNMRNKQATNKSTPVANIGNSFMKEMPMTVFDTTNSFANGGGIHIASNKKGTFTAAATKHGMGVQEFANYVLSHKNKFSAGMVKKANFARNASHWHDEGGVLTQEDNAIDNTQDEQQQAMLAFQAAYEDALKNNKETFDFNGQTYSTADVTAYLQQNNANASYALGGDLQTNGADFTDNLAHVDAGDTHEENPNGGVPMGVAPDGQPNLVEEGETIWNDYVFSNRIKPDKETLEQFHIYSKGGKMTYADLSKKLEDEAKERPNDPISQAALEANMSKLADAQERQKQEEEMRKAMKAFEALSPEEQEALLAQVQQATAKQQSTEQIGEEQYQEQPDDYQGEEQQTYEESPQEQYAQEQQAMEAGYSPEEIQAIQQQAAQQQVMQEQPVEAAEGGELHVFKGGGKKHTGTWKQGWNTSKAWDTYSKPALEAFYEHLYNEVKDIKDPAKKQFVIDSEVKKFNDMQKSYWGIYKNDNLNTSLYGADKAVGAHQTMWNNAGGNAYFSGTDKNGKSFSIADDINLPKGAKTADRYNTWVDNFKGPRTSIRNYGSTEYGDDKYYKDIVDKFGKIGVTMAANPELTYGNGKYQLYTLSTKPDPKLLNAKPIVDIPVPAPPKNIKIKGLPQAGTTANNGSGRQMIPMKAEWPRYVGMFGPVAGLLAAPFTKPNDKYYRESINAVNSRPVLATPTLIGDYEVPNPFALWDAQNKADATRLATNRAIMNNNGSVGQKMTGLIANDNNYYTGIGNLVRTAQEYNNNDENRVKTFNRGTNQYNAGAINRFALANAEAQNQNNQFKANALMNYGNQMAAREDLWKQGILGNVNQLFANIGELGKENAIGNQVAALGNNGVFGVLNNDMLNYGIAGRSAKKKSKGGKLNKRRKGLTF